tara:strand:- start:1151 stop:1312 length:162 start_codon:yes stop_codon:yes gene_type:complete
MEKADYDDLKKLLSLIEQQSKLITKLNDRLDTLNEFIELQATRIRRIEEKNND